MITMTGFPQTRSVRSLASLTRSPSIPICWHGTHALRPPLPMAPEALSLTDCHEEIICFKTTLASSAGAPTACSALIRASHNRSSAGVGCFSTIQFLSKNSSSRSLRRSGERAGRHRAVKPVASVACDLSENRPFHAPPPIKFTNSAGLSVLSLYATKLGLLRQIPARNPPHSNELERRSGAQESVPAIDMG